MRQLQCIYNSEPAFAYGQPRRICHTRGHIDASNATPAAASHSRHFIAPPFQLSRLAIIVDWLKIACYHTVINDETSNEQDQQMNVTIYIVASMWEFTYLHHTASMYLRNNENARERTKREPRKRNERTRKERERKQLEPERTKRNENHPLLIAI